MATTTGTPEKRWIHLDAPRLGHNPAFDGFRGVAIVLVVFYHADVLGFVRGGPILIDCFFVASGFLITSLLLDEQNRRGSVSLRNFYTKRVLRLFPAMYAMLAVFSVIAILGILLLDDSEALANWWVDVLGGGLYVYNIIAAADPNALTGAIGHIWSLTVEEQFYFAWPLALAFALRRGTRNADASLIVGAVVFIAVCFFLRAHFQYLVVIKSDGAVFTDEDDPTWAGFAYRMAAFRPDMIVYGSLAAVFTRRIGIPLSNRARRITSVVGPLCWTWFVIVMALGNRVEGFELWGGWAYQLGLLCIGPAIVDLFLRKDSLFARTFSFKPMCWVGLRTYGIYLWHVIPLVLLLPLISGSSGIPKLLLGLIASALGVLAGIGSFHFIERPFLAMKSRVDQLGAKPAVRGAQGSSEKPT